ncbi:IS5 family transposase [Pricia sp.]|uniref:IS5 family transposase n=1 Tax=Pricia sp. TaxID=2268138 RepID=UPI0035935098
MVQYTSQHQLKIEEFGNLYQMKLDPDNRWIQLAAHFPWDGCAKIYSRHFPDSGRTAIDPRIVIGSLIIKHKLALSDDETVRIIGENPYMQFFLGLDEFSPAQIFSPSLFVEWRKRLGNDTFNGFADVLATICHGDGKVTESAEGAPNKGKLKLDATVADQNITYPNDLGLLNKAREKTEAIIDLLFEHLRDKLKVKPRTYREVARKKYLAESKKRQANKKTLRSAIRYHLNCLDRNVLSINGMLDLLDENPMPGKMLRDLWVVRTVNDQQREMYSEKTNRCDDRIVSISQPYVRPIVRGKAGKKVEFGTKMGLAQANGFAKAETLGWDAYNESADLVPHAESYRELYGYYPELIQVDKIYGTNANRNWCRERGIKMTVAPKGKRPAETVYEKRKRKKEFNERNAIEGKFGQAKQGYGLNNIKAKLSDTSHSWIGAILFVTNLVKFAELNNFHF